MFKSVLQWPKMSCLCFRSIPTLPISCLDWFGDEHQLLPQASGSCDPPPLGNYTGRCPGVLVFAYIKGKELCMLLFCACTTYRHGIHMRLHITWLGLSAYIYMLSLFAKTRTKKNMNIFLWNSMRNLTAMLSSHLQQVTSYLNFNSQITTHIGKLAWHCLWLLQWHLILW